MVPETGVFSRGTGHRTGRAKVAIRKTEGTTATGRGISDR